MKWIFLITGMLFIQLQAQNVSLNIIENTVKVNNDTISFKFIVKNNDTTTLVFYNLDDAELGASFLDTDTLSKTRIPGLFVNIMNKMNKLPSKMSGKLGGEIIINDKYNQSHIIKPYESKEYNVVIDYTPIYLKKRTYKLQLKYYSNDYYKKDFEKMKNLDAEMKNYILYKGIIKSNIVSIRIN